MAVALCIHPFGPVKASSSTTVYVLGVANPIDPLIPDLQSLTTSVVILPSIASLTNLSPGSILYIDGSWIASASALDPAIIPTIVQTILTGVPTVTVRGDPSVLPNSISGLFKFENPGLPLIAEGVQITGTLADGTRQGALLRVISGFDYSVNAEYQWATRLLTQPSPFAAPAQHTTAGRHVNPAAASSDTAPYWTLLLQAGFDTGDGFEPYGQVQSTASLYLLQNSNSTSFNWYNIFTNQTITPGITAYNSNYRNYLETATDNTTRTSNTFVNSGPGNLTSSGPFTATYSIGTLAGLNSATVTSTQTMSYFLKNTNVQNTSNSTYVNWVHTITGGSSVGKLTLQIVPGWTDRVMQGHGVGINGDCVTTFATFVNSNTVSSTVSKSASFAIFQGTS